MRSDLTVFGPQSIDIVKIAAVRQQHSPHNPVLVQQKSEFCPVVFSGLETDSRG
jgi:hypothetical protein